MPSTSTMPRVDITLSLVQAAEAVLSVLSADLTPILWGSPGIGKTTIIEQMLSRILDKYGNSRFSRVLTLDAAAMADGTVQGGIPVPNKEKGVTEWLPPDYFVQMVDDKTLIFLDDIGVLQASALAPLLRMIQFGKVGSFTLPEGTRFICASNRETENAGAQKLTTALNNRMVHIEVVAHAEEVVSYGLRNDWHMTVPMFLRFKSDAVSVFYKNAKVFPSPRTWEYVSRLMHQLEHAPLPENTERALLCGTVGQAYGIEFDAFRKLYKSLPEPDAVLMSPSMAPVPASIDAKYAITGSLLKRVAKDTVGAFLAYMDRMGIIFLIAAMKDLATIDVTLCQTPAYVTVCNRRDVSEALY